MKNSLRLLLLPLFVLTLGVGCGKSKQEKDQKNAESMEAEGKRLIPELNTAVNNLQSSYGINLAGGAWAASASSFDWSKYNDPATRATIKSEITAAGAKAGRLLEICSHKHMRCYGSTDQIHTVKSRAGEFLSSLAAYEANPKVKPSVSPAPSTSTNPFSDSFTTPPSTSTETPSEAAPKPATNERSEGNLSGDVAEGNRLISEIGSMAASLSRRYGLVLNNLNGPEPMDHKWAGHAGQLSTIRSELDAIIQKATRVNDIRAKNPSIVWKGGNEYATVVTRTALYSMSLAIHEIQTGG